MHRRPPHKHHGDLWEFPGGKVESEENPQFALARELAEELGISIDPVHLVHVATASEAEDSNENPIVILLYRVAEWVGDPASHEGGDVGWFSPAQIAVLDKPPLDVELARVLFEKASR